MQDFNNKVSIFVCQHKKYPLLNTDCVVNIHVGKANSNVELGGGIVGDNEGCYNISKKNNNFCELTGLYWIWKNVNSDIVGLMHYRRFFNFGRKRFFCFPGKKPECCDINSDKIKQVFQKCDVVLPKKVLLFPNIYQQYSDAHHKEDLDLCLEIIKQKFPEIFPSCERIMNNKSAYLYNMLIARKDIFDELCNFLFTVLFSLEEQISNRVETYDKYNQRIYGFLSERLVNIFFDYKLSASQIKIKEVPVKMYFPDGFRDFLAMKLRRGK